MVFFAMFRGGESSSINDIVLPQDFPRERVGCGSS
jgi:hypothetical protein